jgi:hypothetical protein
MANKLKLPLSLISQGEFVHTVCEHLPPRRHTLNYVTDLPPPTKTKAVHFP